MILTSTCSAQNLADRDQELLNQVIPDLTGSNNHDTINLHKNVLVFHHQEKVFTKEFFGRYTYRVLGVDSARVKKLIRKLDFVYLQQQKSSDSLWDFSRLPYKLVVYSNDGSNGLKYEHFLKIAKPIYSEDEKFAFVYCIYTSIYGGCSNYSLKVYKKIKKNWQPYVYIPM